MNSGPAGPGSPIDLNELARTMQPQVAEDHKKLALQGIVGTISALLGFIAGKKAR